MDGEKVNTTSKLQQQVLAFPRRSMKLSDADLTSPLPNIVHTYSPL
jgi:hypothetical protein